MGVFTLCVHGPSGWPACLLARLLARLLAAQSDVRSGPPRRPSESCLGSFFCDNSVLARTRGQASGRISVPDRTEEILRLPRLRDCTGLDYIRCKLGFNLTTDTVT